MWAFQRGSPHRHHKKGQLSSNRIKSTVKTEIVDTLVKASKNAFTSQINGHNLETLDQIRRKS